MHHAQNYGTITTKPTNLETVKTLSSFVSILLVTSAVIAFSCSVQPTWKQHPYLFVERNDVPEILRKAERCAWARNALDKIHKSADSWLEKKIELPPMGGRHAVTYICNNCKEPLKTISPTEHKCPKCGKVYTGLPYDARLYEAQHVQYARAAVNLGLAALFYDNKAYARKALDILLAYADKYPTYPLTDTRGTQLPHGARISDQTLNESIWLIDVAWAYDLVLGMGVGTPEEREKVEGLLRASVETIKRNKMGKSNWQAWHNAGIAAVAICLQDESLLNEAICGPMGFYFHMENSILPDGAWYEGSWGYHFYALHALLSTAEMAYRSGINLYECSALKKAFETPLKVLMPNGRLPAIHDATEGHLAYTLYEYAAARYGDPLFAGVVAEQENRDNVDALLVGLEDPKKQIRHKYDSSLVLQDVGLVILRRGSQYLSLDFGPHGGGHGHLDKLSVNYFTRDQVFGPDLGRGWPYNLPIHQEWYKMTLSHNTVTVDEQPQAQCTGAIDFLRLGQESETGSDAHHISSSDADYDIACAHADECYPGVMMRRTVALGVDWLLDVFDVDSDSEHIYDWVWHGRGNFACSVEATPSVLNFTHVSYSYLRNIRIASGTNDWKASWSLPSGKVYAIFKGAPTRQVILCNAPDNPRTNTLHSVILRDRSRHSRFTALFSLKPMDWDDLPVDLKEMISANQTAVATR